MCKSKDSRVYQGFVTDMRDKQFPHFMRVKTLLRHAPAVNLRAVANSTSVQNMQAHLLDNRSGDEDYDTASTPTEPEPGPESDVDPLNDEVARTEAEEELESDGVLPESLEVGEDSGDDAEYEPDTRSKAKSVQTPTTTATKRKRKSTSKASGASDKEEVRTVSIKLS
jgi:hypothetical protein